MKPIATTGPLYVSIILTVIILFAPKKLWAQSCAERLLPNPAQSSEVLIFWQQQLINFKDRRASPGLLDFLSTIVRMAESRAPIDFKSKLITIRRQLLNNPEFMEHHWGKVEAHAFAKDPKSRVSSILNPYVFYALSFSERGQDLVSLTLLPRLQSRELRVRYNSHVAGDYRPEEGILNLNLTHSLCSWVLTLAHELIHAKDDLSLNTFMLYSQHAHSLLFHEHRAFLTEKWIAQELKEKYSLSCREGEAAIAMNQETFRRLMIRHYQMSPERTDEYLNLYPWEIWPHKLHQLTR